MGADIHCYIEHGRKRRDYDADDGSQKLYWSSFGGRINPGRNYAIFGLMAGVRRDDLQLFEPRGRLPREELGIYARLDDEIFISETPGEGYVTRETAQGWVNSGYSEFVDEHWVTSPDHHSHTWLTPDEWEQAITHESLEYPVDDEYFAMLAAMRELQKRGNEVRVVIWFDN